MFNSVAKPPTPPSPGDGRQGWFEGVREGRLSGWTYLPSDPHHVLQVTLTSGDAALSLRADHYRADLQALGLAECCHGFSAPLEALPGAEAYTQCLWTDLGLPLPGAPWEWRHRRPRRMRKGSVWLSLDSPAAGDPRLTGSAYDAKDPSRRIGLRADWGDGGGSATVASLYRTPDCGRSDDGFHGFVLPLPAAPRMLGGGVTIIDADRQRLLVRLGPTSL